MAVRKVGVKVESASSAASAASAASDASKASKATKGVVEQQVMAFADQLDWSLSTIRTKADGWRNSEAVRNEVARIRDGAVRLLEHFSREPESPRKAAPKRAGTLKHRADRGLVDAPGKRHRTPPPQESIDPRLGEPIGKQMGQKSVKNGMRRGRG